MLFWLDGALQRPAEPLEGSANSELYREMAPEPQAGSPVFLQLTFPIMPTQPASVFTTRVEEATGERRKVRMRKKTTRYRNTVGH